jgi:hypothetical protein
MPSLDLLRCDTRAHLAFVGPCELVGVGSEFAKHVRSRQALLGPWPLSLGVWPSHMTPAVCTIALSPDILKGSMFNPWVPADHGWCELPDMAWGIYRKDPRP